MLIKQFPKRQLHMALSLLINFDNFRIRKSEHFKGLLTDLPVRVPRTFKSASPECPDVELHASQGPGGQASAWSVKVREIINTYQNDNSQSQYYLLTQM